MPYRYSPYAKRTTVRGATKPGRMEFNRQPKLLALRFEAIEAAVEDAVEIVVDRMATSAERIAVNRAPVRRVFQGGRATFRKLSVEELVAETPAFLRTLSPAQRKQIGTVKAGSFPASRLGVRVQTHRNRANTWRNTEYDRQVVIENATYRVGKGGKAFPTSGRLALFNKSAEYSLNAEGRRVLRKARFKEVNGSLVDVGRGGIWVDPGDPKNMSLGGNLRKSVHKRPAVADSRGRIRASVVAGGPRAPYAKFMEFGTRYVAARPFLRPALKSVELSYSQRLQNEIRRKLGQKG